MIIIHNLLSFFHVFWQLYQVFTCKNFLLFPVMKATHASLPLSILIMSLCIRRSFEEKHHYDLSSKCVRGMKGKMELKTANQRRHWSRAAGTLCTCCLLSQRPLLKCSPWDGMNFWYRKMLLSAPLLPPAPGHHIVMFHGRWGFWEKLSLFSLFGADEY